MRLDKFLKAAKILKRRTVSNAITKQSKVLINDRPAKPARPVKVGDKITIRFGNRILSVWVLNIETPKPKSEELMYEVIDSHYVSDEE